MKSILTIAVIRVWLWSSEQNRLHKDIYTKLNPQLTSPTTITLMRNSSNIRCKLCANPQLDVMWPPVTQLRLAETVRVQETFFVIIAMNFFQWLWRFLEEKQKYLRLHCWLTWSLYKFQDVNYWEKLNYLAPNLKNDFQTPPVEVPNL